MILNSQTKILSKNAVATADLEDMEETLIDKEKEDYGSTSIVKAPVVDDDNRLDLDEVYKIIGQGPAQYLYWFLTGLLSVSDLSEIGIISVILPLQRCEWELSPAFEGAVSMSVFTFYAMFAMVFGKISDTFGRKFVLKWSMIILTIATITSALAPNKWVFIVARSVTGACIGTNFNCIICYATGSGAVSIFYYMDPQIVTGLIFTASVLGFVMAMLIKKETKDVVMKDT